MTTDKFQVNLRAVVLDILTEADCPGAMSHVIIGNALAKYQYLDKQERSFVSKLAQGSIEKRLELDYIIDLFSNTPVQKQKPVIRRILELSVYQLKYMKRVPPSAVCNEAVKLAAKRGFGSLKGFVNGVLRNIARNVEHIPYPDKKREFLKYLSVTYSFPQWLPAMWIEQYGEAGTEALLMAFDRENTTFIRCNTTKISPQALQERLRAEGIAAETLGSGFPEYALKISGYDYMGNISAFEQGLFQVQDLSSMMAGEGGLIKPADYVIDVCAAPGGKAVNAALKAVKGHVEARDVSDAKISMIESNVRRLGLTNLSLKRWDATVRDPEAVAKADVVIADLPCSGLGIIGRKPDIKYHVDLEKIESLAKLQKEILSVIWEYVKPGGTLIYSTCTLNTKENEENVEWFCANYPFVKIQDCKTILPGDNDTDGFFIAGLRRN